VTPVYIYLTRQTPDTPAKTTQAAPATPATAPDKAAAAKQ